MRPREVLGMVLVLLEVGQVWPRRSGILGGYVLGYRDMVTKTSSLTKSEVAYRLQADGPVARLGRVAWLRTTHSSS